MIYGITGKIASGKNYVASLIALKGYQAIDLDVMAKDSYEVLEDKIKELFGTTDRSQIATQVFENTEKRKALESLIYPYLRNEIKKIDKASDTPVFINGALLRRAGLDKLCTFVIYVDASERLRFRRAARRNGMKKSDFLKRDAAQKDVDFRKNKYRCPVEPLLNERNKHLKSELNSILRRYGLKVRRPRTQVTEIKEIHMTDKPKDEIVVTVSADTPYVSNDDMYIFPESGRTHEPVQKKKKSSHKGLGWLILILVLAAAVFCYLKFFKPQPVQEIKTTSPIEKPVISDVVERLAEKKEITPVELPPEVKAVPAKKVQEPIAVEEPAQITEQTSVVETPEEPLPVVDAPAYVEPVSVVETPAEPLSVVEVPAPQSEPVSIVETPAEPLPVIETPTSVEPISVIESPVEAQVVEPASVVKVPTTREELHTQAIENLPGDLKDIVKNL